MIKIDKDVPLPPKTTGPNSCSKYPWREMKIGDSFLVKGGSTKSGMTGAAPQDIKDRGWKFSARMTENGVRVWRIK